jgi:LPS-assembly lipoprotein
MGSLMLKAFERSGCRRLQLAWPSRHIRALARLGLVLGAAGLLVSCWEPLYGRSAPSAGGDSVADKLAEVLIPPIPVRQGTPQARLAVELRNALQFDFNGAGGAVSPTHRLDIVVTPTNITVLLDPVTGVPTNGVGGITATYKLVEIATGKVVLTDSTFAHVGYDMPGPQQRFASQRAQLNAEDQAVKVAAEAIRNRLASYFVAGT